MKRCLPILLAILLAVSVSYAESTETESEIPALRFDGLYCCLLQNPTANVIFRFYEDGTVIRASIGQTAKSKSLFPKWLSRDGDPFKGLENFYVLEGNHLELTTSVRAASGVSTAAYHGTVEKNRLLLTKYPDSNKKEYPERVYEFIPFVEIEGWEE